MAKPIKAVELELSLAGTNTTQKPISQSLDKSGKITFEYDKTQAKAIQAVLDLGYDDVEDMAWSLKVLVQRGVHSVTKNDGED